jgi:hypothetical protein
MAFMAFIAHTTVWPPLNLNLKTFTENSAVVKWGRQGGPIALNWCRFQLLQIIWVVIVTTDYEGWFLITVLSNALVTLRCIEPTAGIAQSV